MLPSEMKLPSWCRVCTAGDGSDKHQQHGESQELKTWPIPLKNQRVADAINFPPALRPADQDLGRGDWQRFVRRESLE